MKCQVHKFAKIDVEKTGFGARYSCHKCRMPIDVDEAYECSSCGVVSCILCSMEHAVDSNDLDRYIDFPQVEESPEPEIPEIREIETEDWEKTPTFDQIEIVEDIDPYDIEVVEDDGYEFLFGDIQEELNQYKNDGAYPLEVVEEPVTLEEKVKRKIRGESATPSRIQKSNPRIQTAWDDVKTWLDD